MFRTTIALILLAITPLALAATPASPPEELPTLLMPTPVTSFWFEDTPQGHEWIEQYKVRINNKPVTPPTVATWGGKITWVVPTPEPGDYILCLQMVSGEKRPGVFAYKSGDQEIRTKEFREPGGFTACQKVYRITVPAGQTETAMSLSGTGVYLGRVDLAPAPKSPRYADGKIHALAPSSYRTVLKDANGKDRAIVVLPPKGDPARSLAEALATKLALPTKPEAPLASPFPEYPVSGISPDTNLIVLSVSHGGPLATAMRRAEMIETGHVNPGPGGYVIRVIARPFRGAANVIFLGASDAEGLKKAVTTFAPRKDEKTGETLYDRFLDAQFAKEWLAIRPGYLYDAPNAGYLASWTKRLAQPYAGYKHSAPARSFINRTARWGDLYYRSGSVPSAEMFKRFIFKMEDDHIYGGSSKNRDSHMAMYHLMRAWDRVEEAPCFSDADRLRIVNYLYQCAEGDEGFGRSYGGYRDYTGPVRMRHNHQTILGCGLTKAYLYYSRLYDLGRADMWKSWCDTLVENGTYWGHAPEDSSNYEPGTFMEVRDMLHYQGLSTKGPDGTHAWPETALRFAAIRDSFGLPACYGDCWNVLETTRLQFFEMMRDDWDWAGGQALLDHAARGYAHALRLDADRIPADIPGGPFYAQTNGSTDVGGVLPAPDPEAVAEALRPITGLAAVPMGRGYYEYMSGKVGHKSFWKTHGRPDAPPYEKTADKIQYRAGWDVDSEYLLIEALGWANHGHMDLGTLVQYCRDGRLWIVDGGYENTQVRHHSTLELKRDGKPGWHQYEGAKGRWGDFRDGPQMAEIVSLKPDQPGTPGPFEVVLRVKGYAGATWLRTVSGGGGRPLTVVDEITAEQTGEYEATVRYRLLGKVTGKAGSWHVAQKGAAMSVALAAESADTVGLAKWEPDAHTVNQGRYPAYKFLPDEDAALPDKSKEKGIPKTIEWTRKRTLKPGEKMTFRATIAPKP